MILPDDVRWDVWGWDHPARIVPTMRIGRYRWLWRARLAAWWFNATSIDGHAWVEMASTETA